MNPPSTKSVILDLIRKLRCIVVSHLIVLALELKYHFNWDCFMLVLYLYLLWLFSNVEKLSGPITETVSWFEKLKAAPKSGTLWSRREPLL